MGEWGKWWSSRGADQNVKCTFCGRNVPKHKAVQVNNSGRLGRDIYELAEVVSMGGVKGYACLSCAKHRHLVKDGIHTTEKEKWAKQRSKDKREMDKVMVKVKEMERKEKGVKPREDKPAAPKAAYPKTEAPKVEAPKTEAPKAAPKEAPKEVPKAEHKKPAVVPAENEA
jgi:ribosomal protein S26